MIFSFDTSLEVGSFCFIENNKVIYMESYLKNQSHSSLFPLRVKNALKNMKKSLKEIKKLVVCVGPGSFTGIKIGLSFAKGIKSALNIKAVGVSTLRSYAYPYFLYTPTLVILKAPKNGAYAACFYKLDTLLKEGFYILENIKKFINDKKELFLVGNHPIINELSNTFFKDDLEKPLALNAYYVSKLFPLPLKANYLKEADVNLEGVRKIMERFKIE
ncbi:MAG TPA: tRNA (adenosine(37)-N6)-threonylcarbamoyltransferase complex dimerization subunit type 1 TsaB [Aquificae bacterium]|nr:tRNA (adenosine(37)-N6)-threonylcarbamoyltransferase complex dimerization subunit type 1 TsaB [Aquificota bacterium]